MNRKATKGYPKRAVSKSRKSIRIKRPPVLFARTQKVIRQILPHVDGTFMVYWTSEQGAICGNDVQATYEVLRAVKPGKHLTILVKSDGGDGQSALRIIHLLREHADRLTVLVPLACASAATMLALGADEIQMGPLAFLTPVDTSLDHPLGPIDRRNEPAFVGQDELQRAVALWERHARDSTVNPFQELYKYLHPLVIGAVDRANSLSIRLCRDILQYHMSDRERAVRIAETLNSNYPAHEYPITPNEARQLGLNVTEMKPELHVLLLALNDVYAEMGQRSVTDFDESNYHDNEIVNIVEGPGIQLFFQNDKDWHYRTEERQWASLRVESSWHRVTVSNGRITRRKIYLS